MSSKTPSPSSVGRLTEKVYRALLNDIKDGRFEARSKLPTERELAETFAVSRPVIRNALALLRRDGLVRSVQGSGTAVVYDPAVVASEPVAPSSSGGSVRDLQRCFEFRMLIEGEAAYAAAMRHNPRTLERMTESAYTPKVSSSDRDPNRVYETFDFHRAVVKASDNPFLQQSLDFIVSSAGFRIYLARRRLGADPIADLARVNAEHIEIMRLIERRQAADAREAMNGHIQRAYDHFMERVPLSEGIASASI